MSKTQVICIGALLFLLVAAAALAWFLYTVSKAGVELEQKMELIADRNAKVKMHTELSRLIEQTQSQREQLSKYVLTQANTSNFLTGVEQTGAALGVQITTQSLKVTPESGKFDSLYIEFAVEGGAAAVREMLRVLEVLPYHSGVGTLSFAKTGTDNVRATVGLNVSLGKYDE